MILALETSGKACSVALSEQGETICQQLETGDWRHSQVITLLIQACLSEAGKQMSDISAVAVSQGPGSYTGLRVGASCAKGICYAQDIPLISVPTLEIIAQPFIQQGSDRQLVPMIDARRMEVYYNIYDQQLHSAQETTNLVLDESVFEDYAQENLLFCGDGAHKMSDFIVEKPNWSIESSIAEAKNMSQSAFSKFQSGSTENLAYYVPFYLKPPNITKSKKPLF